MTWNTERQLQTITHHSLTTVSGMTAISGGNASAKQTQKTSECILPPTRNVRILREMKSLPAAACRMLRFVAKKLGLTMCRRVRIEDGRANKLKRNDKLVGSQVNVGGEASA